MSAREVERLYEAMEALDKAWAEYAHAAIAGWASSPTLNARLMGVRERAFADPSPSPAPPPGESRTPCADGPCTLSSPGCAGPSLQETEQ